jgi:hypothetical protein
VKAQNDCGHPGAYGTTPEGEQLCYECCGERDRQAMRQGNKILLYLEEKENRLTNWPGTLIVPLERMRRKHHPACCERIDVWFTFEGAKWHGVSFGANTQACHCKKLKPPRQRPSLKLKLEEWQRIWDSLNQTMESLDDQMGYSHDEQDKLDLEAAWKRTGALQFKIGLIIDRLK